MVYDMVHRIVALTKGNGSELQGSIIVSAVPSDKAHLRLCYPLLPLPSQVSPPRRPDSALPPFGATGYVSATVPGDPATTVPPIRREMAMRNPVLRLILVMALPLAVNAQVERLVIGEGGLDWRESSEDLLGLDDSVTLGSLQPFELDPLINIGVGPKTEKGQSTNILGFVWGSDSRSTSIGGGAQMPPVRPKENQ